MTDSGLSIQDTQRKVDLEGWGGGIVSNSASSWWKQGLSTAFAGFSKKI